MPRTPLIATPTLAVVLWAGSAIADDHSFEQQESHVHGQATLMVAIDGGSVDLLLDSPAINIVGFEHLPEDDAQNAAVSKALEILLQPEVLFELSEDAQCSVAESNVQTPLTQPNAELAEHDDHEEGHQHEQAEDHEAHAEFSGHYRFECARPESLKEISVKLFEPFPSMERIIATLVSDAGQTQLPLTAQHNRIQTTTP